MLPVARGDAATRRQIVAYSVALVAFTVLPFLTGLFGSLYLAAALLLGAGFIGLAAQLACVPRGPPPSAFIWPRSPTWRSCSVRWPLIA